MLARAAIPNAHRKKSSENARKRKRLVSRWFEHLKMFGMFIDECSQTPDMSQRQDWNKKPREQENNNLQKISPRGRAKPAVNCVYSGCCCKEHNIPDHRRGWLAEQSKFRHHPC